MNPKRILIALIAAFIALSATDYLIHQVWLKNTYALDIGKLWRTETDMQAHMSGIFIGQFLIAIAFTMLWTRIALGGAGIQCAIALGGAGIQCAIALGVFMGLAYSGGVVIQGAVQPLPDGLVMKWIISGILQSVLVSVVLFFVHKPAKGCPDINGK